MKILNYILTILLILTVSVSVYIINAQSALYQIEQANRADYTACLMQANVELVAQNVSLKAELSEQQEIIEGIQLKPLGEFEVTFYCYNSGTTKSGTRPDDLTVAVDESVIPLGSLLYIEGYGLKRAEDIGGAVKGNIIDIYVPDHDKAIQLGRKQNIKVWIIESEGK